MKQLETLKDRARNEGFIFEAIKDLTGVKGISLSFHAESGLEHFVVMDDNWHEFRSFIDSIFSHEHEKVCFDMRDVLALGCYFKSYCDVIDISLLYKNDNLYSTVNKNLKESDISLFIEQKNKHDSHIKVCQTAKIDLKKHSITDIIPHKFYVSFLKRKNEMVSTLRDKLEDIEWYKNIIYNRARVLYEIELNDIKIDVHAQLDGTLSTSEKSFLEHTLSKIDEDNCVHAKFAVSTTKTGRSSTAKGSFKCMSIPKSSVRRSIVSGLNDGRIVVFDYNAADYRCVVAAIDDNELTAQYTDQDDFHVRTVEAIFGTGKSTNVRRRVIKSVTYMSLYGGSKKSVMKSTGLGPDKIDLLLKKMDFMKPIHEFRDELHRTSIKQGYVTSLNGVEIRLDGSEHPGKVLALFAQTTTNDVFMDGLINVHDWLTRSAGDEHPASVLFTVHDEIVMDMPRDSHLDHDINQIRDIMELGSARLLDVKLKVKVSTGPNYWDQENYD